MVLATDPLSPQFKENADAWLLVDKILEHASYPQTKCKSTPKQGSNSHDG